MKIIIILHNVECVVKVSFFDLVFMKLVENSFST